MEDKEAMVTVYLQPTEKTFTVPRVRCKTVARLLQELGLRQTTAIVVRDGTLLTPDVPLYSGQSVLVRKVMSSG